MKSEGIISRYSKEANGTTTPLRLTTLGSLAVAAVESAGHEQARAGRRYAGGCQLIAAGIAPDATIPSTTAKLALYNGQPDDGLCLFIERLTFCLGSGTPAAGATLLVCVAGPIATVPAMAANYLAGSTSGGGRGTKSVFATAVTLPGAPVWFGLTSTMQLAAANVGQGDGWAQSDGGIMIPPRYALGIAIFSGAGTTPLYTVSAQWAELESDKE